MLSADEAALVERARQGDEQAMEQLLQSVQPQLYRFSIQMCRQSEDAEDVLQNTMLSMARSLHQFRGTSSVSTWMYTIARRYCMKQRRKSKFAPAHEESLDSLGDGNQVAAPGPTPESAAATTELWESVREAILQLDKPHREVLILRDIEGLSAKEVSQVVEISVSAVKSRLHRARGAVRDHIAAQRYTPPEGCPNIHLRFSQYLENDLSQKVCESMQAHVESCPSCATECDGLKRALQACTEMRCEVPLDVQERVRTALRQLMPSVP